MTTKQSELHELIAALRNHYEKVGEMTAWLELKQSELRPGNELSFLGFMEAQKNLILEQSILAGHVFMIEEDIRTHSMNLDPADARALQEIARYCRIVAGDLP